MESLTRRDRALSRTARYALGGALVGGATWLELLLAGADNPQFSPAPLALAVAIAAVAGGFGPGLFTVCLSVLAADYFVVEPGAIFNQTSNTRAIVLVAHAAAWLLVSWLAGRVYRRMQLDERRRVDAEGAAAQSDRVAQLTAALAQARTPRAAIEAIVQEPLHALGADAALLLLVAGDGSAAELERAVGYGQEEQDAWRRVLLSSKSPISDAVGRGAPVILESRDARAVEYPGEPNGSAAGTRFHSTVVVPLSIGSRVAAVVELDFREPRAFSAADRDYLATLAARGAQTLDRTWQVEFAQRARAEAETLRARADEELSERQSIEHALRASEARYRTLAARTSRLHGLTAALSEAVTLSAVAQAVVHHGRIAVGATGGEVTLLVGNGSEFETLYAENGDERSGEAHRFPVDTGLCGTQAVQTRRPVFVASFAEWQERYWRSASIAADGGYTSSATLPLLVEGTAIGVLAFHFTAPVNFDEAYQALLVSVAQHCAQALDRSRLYDSAQRARTDAEAANRLKDEFVSIVSHELRTPLNSILGWTSMLQRGTLDASTSARALQSIHDNATRQAKLVDELLDFSRIIAGRTTLDLEDVDLRDLVRGVVESMIPAASAAGLELHLAPIPSVKVVADVRRLEQVFFNLIGNAIKFTPNGGRVAIGVSVQGSQVLIRVSDSGIGIDPAFLPHVFDRFRQADRATTRAHGGLGLGLSIARQLVDAHKGTITAASEGAGTGATFTVALPVATASVALIAAATRG
jgi:signal transduction histidine kinase